jgi:phosphoglycerol transferase MdoB-like AlkP superfamily enzyme
MSPELSAACQIFIVPASILFVALAVAPTEELKALLAALVLGISILFFVRVWIWRGLLLIADQYTALGLALIFLFAALISVFVHGREWGRRREAPPPQAGA